MKPFISICIPAFKRTGYLQRLLDSISIQSYRDFEVIVTDDSNDSSVVDVIAFYQKQFQLIYKKNKVPLGPPENWNEAVREANGEWIKIMHDDDWFANPDSLYEFADAIKQNPGSSFFYCAYINVFEDTHKQASVYTNPFRRRKLQLNPETLFSKNVVGPPSVTLVRNDKKIWYDKKIKWVVDIDFYTRYLKSNSPFYINKLLVKIGINGEQVTKSTFRVASVEIPENFYLLEKWGIKILKNILIYDACWRMIRNLRITSLAKIRDNGYYGDIHFAITSMINWQSKIPFQILKTGLLSKIIMFIHYLIYRRFLK
jgi:glycosyltransferase involved in cell wall biosynthesis